MHNSEPSRGCRGRGKRDTSQTRGKNLKSAEGIYISRGVGFQASWYGGGLYCSPVCKPSSLKLLITEDQLRIVPPPTPNPTSLDKAPYFEMPHVIRERLSYSVEYHFRGRWFILPQTRYLACHEPTLLGYRLVYTPRSHHHMFPVTISYRVTGIV